VKVREEDDGEVKKVEEEDSESVCGV